MGIDFTDCNGERSCIGKAITSGALILGILVVQTYAQASGLAERPNEKSETSETTEANETSKKIAGKNVRELGLNESSYLALYHYLERAEAELLNHGLESLQEISTIQDVKGTRLNGIFQASELASLQKEWALLDPEKDKVEGTRTEKLYKEVEMIPPKEPVIVAVIDSGIDIHHGDLRENIWVNEIEANGLPGVDDDMNGYVDDVYGWNFLGNSSGENVRGATLEVTREYVRMKRKASEGPLNEEERKYLELLRNEVKAGRKSAEQTLDILENQYLPTLEAALAILRRAGLKDETVEAINAVQSDDPLIIRAKNIALEFIRNGLTTEVIKANIEYYRNAKDYYYNEEFDISAIIKDDPAKLDEVGYGNPDVNAGTALHGTHVAGIIGAIRDNGIGINGQAKYVKIMALRAVPNGDERDKDIANAVKYAVNQGAKVINMSFGKAYSPNKDYVDEAFAYAEAMDVLVVHSAGNDAKNVDQNLDNFPNRRIRNEPRIEFKNWIEVAASSALKGDKLPAVFTNYGRNTVDLFAPGVNVLSTAPGNSYASLSGTSMAGPEVAGIAALIRSQFPELSAVEVKERILSSVRQYPGLKVRLPGPSGNMGGPPSLVDFGGLTISGGIVDAYSAFFGQAARALRLW